MNVKKIVLIGAGFGGIAALIELSKSSEHEITLVSKSENFIFTPLIHETIAGKLNKEDISKLLNIADSLLQNVKQSLKHQKL